MMETKQKTNQYDLKGYMAFTWVPDPKDIGISPGYQYRDTMPSICNLQHCCDRYVVVPECTIAGNIHYHGLLKINDKYKWYKKVLPTFKYHGYVCIKNKQIDDKWIDYIFKEFDVTSKIYKIQMPISMKLINGKVNLPYQNPECSFEQERFMHWLLNTEE